MGLFGRIGVGEGEITAKTDKTTFKKRLNGQGKLSRHQSSKGQRNSEAGAADARRKVALKHQNQEADL